MQAQWQALFVQSAMLAATNLSRVNLLAISALVVISNRQKDRRIVHLVFRVLSRYSLAL
jgi:hypothetical protein